MKTWLPFCQKREDELSALVAGEGTLSEALLVPLSVKECIFMICRLQQMNEQAEMPDYNEKGQLLYDAVVEKLKMSSSLYILLDKVPDFLISLKEPLMFTLRRSWQSMPFISMRTSTTSP